MTTYSIRGFKTEINGTLSDPDAGQEVIITRRREPRGRLASVHQPTGGERLLNSLEGSLPDGSYENVLDIKALWAPRARRTTSRKKPAVG